MSARTGRSVTLTWGGSPVAGVREKGVAAAGEPIDVTSDENSGWRTLLTEAGQNEVTVSLSGVTKDTVLRSAWYSGARTATVVLGYPGGATLTGSFYLASYSESDPFNGAATFDAELQSTGAPAYAAGAAPTNTVLPAVIGTPQQGVAVTAYRGEWTGAPTSFSYQWQQDDSGWANIAGATGQSYTPVAGNVGNPLRVIVTATNSAGSTSATSGPSADVLAP